MRPPLRIDFAPQLSEVVLDLAAMVGAEAVRLGGVFARLLLPHQVGLAFLPAPRTDEFHFRSLNTTRIAAVAVDAVDRASCALATAAPLTASN